MKQRAKLSGSNQGMVAIMTVMVLMVVIGLIVIGFAQLSRRNARQTLDRQMSTQAYYAAETGVNDVRKVIQDKLENARKTNSTFLVPDKTKCQYDAGEDFYAALQYNLSGDNKYSCLLVDASPEQLRYSSVSQPSIIVPVVSANGVAIKSLTFHIQAKNNNTPMTNCPSSFAFTPYGSWNCGYGVFRADVVPTDGNINFTSLRTNTMTLFGVAMNGGPTEKDIVNYIGGTSNPNNRIRMKCTNSDCTLTIDNLNTKSAYLRLSSIYKEVSLSIDGKNVDGGDTNFMGGQLVIDSTGRSGDVLRRVQVSVPINNSSQNELSDYAIQTTDSICKRFSVIDSWFRSDGGGSGASSLCSTWE